MLSENLLIDRSWFASARCHFNHGSPVMRRVWAWAAILYWSPHLNWYNMIIFGVRIINFNGATCLNRHWAFTFFLDKVVFLLQSRYRCSYLLFGWFGCLTAKKSPVQTWIKRQAKLWGQRLTHWTPFFLLQIYCRFLTQVCATLLLTHLLYKGREVTLRTLQTIHFV